VELVVWLGVVLVLAFVVLRRSRVDDARVPI
jgi:hypothetical protein